MSSSKEALTPAIDMIKEFEGCKLKAYWDATGKVWTIGYGTTVYPDGSPVEKGDELTTQAVALAYMLNDIKTIRLPGIRKCVKAPLTINELCALISLAYNIGTAGLARSSIISRLNAGASRVDVADRFLLYNKSGGKVLRGLVRRRKAERELFLRREVVNFIA